MPPFLFSIDHKHVYSNNHPCGHQKSSTNMYTTTFFANFCSCRNSERWWPHDDDRQREGDGLRAGHLNGSVAVGVMSRRRGSSGAQREKRKRRHTWEEGKWQHADEDLVGRHLGREGMKGARGVTGGLNPSYLGAGGFMGQTFGLCLPTSQRASSD